MLVFFIHLIKYITFLLNIAYQFLLKSRPILQLFAIQGLRTMIESVYNEDEPNLFYSNIRSKSFQNETLWLFLLLLLSLYFTWDVSYW